MVIGGPSALHAAVKISKKAIKHKSDRDKLINKPTKLTKLTRHNLRSPQSVDPDSSSPENADAELGSIWADSKTPPTVKGKEPVPHTPKSTSPVACPSGSQNITVTAEVHCSQGGTTATRQGAQKPASSAGAPAEQQSLDVIQEEDDFTVITPKQKRKKLKATVTISEAAINTALPSTSTPETQVSGTSPHKNQFLTAPREKIPPVVIHRHFQGDMTRLNRDFHSQFQPGLRQRVWP
jgi:hypothetical protein